MNEIGIV